MTSSTTVYLQGEIVEESVEFTLGELSRASGASEEELSLWVEEGVFEPDAPGEGRGQSAARRQRGGLRGILG
jgi:chaperone modulatory protein CbpM